jgi:AMMECR1 domain-containing protein
VAVDRGWNREEFLENLCLKAGLPGDFWAEDVKLSRYTVSKWRETDFI